MERLTPRQQMIFEFIKDCVRKKGYPPSVREIGEGIGLRSSSTVHAHLTKLEQKGYIRRDPTKPRAIEILQTDPPLPPSFQPTQLTAVPLLGRVAAGIPILAEENIEGYVSLPQDIVRSGVNQFCLKIKGDSMMNAGILNGDTILVRQQNYAENGEIIVAMLENEATVKRFYRLKDKVKLQPENPAYEPIYSRDAVVLGKVVAVFRLL